MQPKGRAKTARRAAILALEVLVCSAYHLALANGSVDRRERLPLVMSADQAATSTR